MFFPVSVRLIRLKKFSISTNFKKLINLIKILARKTTGKNFFIIDKTKIFKKTLKIFLIFSVFLIILGLNFTIKTKALDKLNNFSKRFFNNLIGLNVLDKGQGGFWDKFLIIDNNASILRFLNIDPKGRILGGIFSGDQGDFNGKDSDEKDGEIFNSKVTYVVKKGDTLTEISQKFGVKITTILWANKIKNPKLIKPGDKLEILPVDGVEYKVEKGDTLFSIAKRFKGDVKEIIDFNGLSSNGKIYPGQVIIIPDGEIIHQNRYVYQKRKRRSFSGHYDTSYFAMPATGYNWGIRHPINAVDIANSCGTPVRAAADGKVIYVSFTRSTWRYANGGYGNNIRIMHPNGTITVYAHLLYNSQRVKMGDIVNKRQTIALIGGKPGMRGAGHSTGCHVHFEVRGGRNPFVRY